MPLMLRLVGEGYPLCLPVMQGKGKPLVFRRWQPGDELAETTWGIREPLPEAPSSSPTWCWPRCSPSTCTDTGSATAAVSTIARSLRCAAKPVVVIGLAYDEQRVDAVPHLDYDQRLDWVLTPSGPLRCPRS